MPTPSPVANAATVDVEDWHALFYRELTGEDPPPSEHVVTGARVLMEVLAEYDVRATFFVTGPCARAFPRFVREIAEAGHEVACHGWAHRRTSFFTPAEFRADLHRALSTLTDVLGAEVEGFRAPLFSVGPSEMWALSEIAAAGFRYDSSLSPQRFAAQGQCLKPGVQLVQCPDGGPQLIEVPMTTTPWLGKIRNIGGGRWFRTLPYGAIVGGFRGLNQAGVMAQTYTHTYEGLPYPLRVPPPLGTLRLRVLAWLTEMLFAVGHGATLPRLRRLLADCGPWLPLREIVARSGLDPNVPGPPTA